MVMVEIDSNAILVKPMKNRTDEEMKRAYQHLLLRLKRAGIKPKKHVLDNEVSESMKDMIRDEYNIELELVPPGCHRRNAAEVAIRNFKCHFLSILAGVADDFPIQLWDRLLPQAEITLNLLRQSNATPNVSAYAHLSGPFDYNKMPLAPMGSKVQVHEKTDDRGTWAFHSVDGWYLYTSPEHYRTHVCHIKDTQAERLSDTVDFQCKQTTNPTVKPIDKVMHAIVQCAKTIEGMSNGESDEEIRDLQQLMEVTKRTMKRHGDQACEKAAAEVPTDRLLGRPAEFSNIPDPEPPMRVTRSMSQQAGQEQSIQRVPIERSTPAVPRAQSVPRVPVEQSIPTVPSGQSVPRVPAHKPNIAPSKSTTPKAKRATSSPARNTRSKASPPAANTRSRAKTLKGLALAVEKKAKRRTGQQKRVLRRLTRAVERVEEEVFQALAVLDHDTGKLLKYRQLLRDPKHKKEWSKSAANEFGRLADGVGGRVKGTQTMKFIHKHGVPKDRIKDVTYASFLCKVRNEKAEKNRTRMCLGGNLLKATYPGETGTPTAEMLVAKILFNSVISTKKAKFMSADLANFYLNTPLLRPEYVRLKLSDIPEEIIKEYNLLEKVKNGYVYIEINKGMYGLPQSGILANELLEKRLNKHGYKQSKLVPGLWKHETRPIQFTLVVDDFGVKYERKRDVDHLMRVLKQHYDVKEDWTGSRYIGITLDWDYKKRQVHLSMPGYVKKALLQFNHAVPAKRQDSPFPHTPPNYGAKVQYAKQRSTAEPLDKKGKRFIQQVCGKFLYYGRAVDSSILTAISAIASQQSNPTEETLAQTYQLLDYLATQEEAVITYSASDMTLAVHSDASYLNETNARSRAGGHFFLSNNNDVPTNNGAIFNIAHIIQHVMSSATEAELAALYIMAREAVYIRIILEEMGHKQPPTPIQTDNAMAEGVINKKVQPKRTKAMDMRFHWLRDRECQEQFRFYWRPGKMNYADYWTKHHAPKHHKHIRRDFLTPAIVLEMLRTQQASSPY